MKINLTWYGAFAFSLKIGAEIVLIDPFFTGNESAPFPAAQVDATFILITHGHFDHVGDVIAIAKRTGALVISNSEICNWLQFKGVETFHSQHIGGGYTYPFGRLKMTIAQHGSGLPDGSYGGSPAGFLLTSGNKRIYFAGDTGLYYGMCLIGEENVDLAVLPIGDKFTMGPDDALRALHLIHPRTVIPAHYNRARIDPYTWAERVEAETPTKAVVLEPGESYQV
ncbi:MAG: metal-dependent hydrolase [Anaerolineales bacterium]|nr:metal-dependent hydrolase [Anaerolineales bacterium]